MSMRKKRSLSGVVADDTKNTSGNIKIILPATSRTQSEEKNHSFNEVVRGTEFLVGPDNFRPWKFHNRDDAWMNIEKCSDLISSIRKNGQKVPIFARKIENPIDGKSWEIIAGRRRWFACNYLGIKVRVKATDANDRECAILMNLENKDRNDISEFEDAFSFKQQLDAKLFDSQDEMSAALDLKKSKLSKMLAAAKILSYPEVFELFEDVTLLKINPVYNLVLQLEKNEQNKIKIINKANILKKIISTRSAPLKTNVIINELLSVLDENVENEKKFCHRNFKIDGKTILKTTEITKRKVTFEFNRSNSLSVSQENVLDLLTEALKYFQGETVVS